MFFSFLTILLCTPNILDLVMADLGEGRLKILQKLAKTYLLLETTCNVALNSPVCSMAYFCEIHIDNTSPPQK